MFKTKSVFSGRGVGIGKQWMPARAGAALLFGVAALLAASRAGAQVRVPTHVACVGDSLTAGLFASSPAASYPSVLQTMFGSSVQVMNFGVSSTTMMSVADNPYQNQSAYTAATTFVSGAGTSAVVDVIIMLGTNDSKGYNWMTSATATRAQQFVTDCGAMVDHFATLPTHPLVYLAFPSRSFANTYGISGAIIHDQMLPLLQQVATAKGIPIIDVDTPTSTHPELFPDGVHPNDTGYALIAQVMHDGLLRPLAAGTDAGATDAGGAGGRGTGGASAGTGGRGAGGTTGAGGMGVGGSGTGGARADAGQPDAVATGTGGTTSGSGGATGAGGAAGSGTSGGSGCSCRLTTEGTGGDFSNGAFALLLLAAACASLTLRSPRPRPRGRGLGCRQSVAR